MCRVAPLDAGLIDIEIIATHRVHTHAAAAIIGARKASPAGHAALTGQAMTGFTSRDSSGARIEVA